MEGVKEKKGTRVKNREGRRENYREKSRRKIEGVEGWKEGREG